MKLYSNSKIFKLFSPSSDYVFIGGTTAKELYTVKDMHKYGANKWKLRRKHWNPAYEVSKYEDFEIELIEEFSCDNVEQLNARVREWKDNTKNCL
jgi:hypothetical protein